MSDARGLLVAAGVVMLLGFLAASCIKQQRHEDCTQRGGQLVRVEGSEYECRDPAVK